MTRCTYDPKPLVGVPLGMHHCPICACMVIAALEHGPCDDDCPMQDDADRAIWAEAPTEPETQEETL